MDIFNGMVDIKCNDEGLRELALFAGAGGGILGGILLGWRTVCAVEYNAYARSVLLARQNDGTLAPFPVWDDVRTFDGKPWRGLVDVVSGGFPCTDISAAGRGAGIDGAASGLWREMARIICEVQPRFVFVENSPILTSRGLGRVLGDLASMGFHAEWGVISAADAGASHLRERIWIVADFQCMRRRKYRSIDSEREPFHTDQWQESSSWIGSSSEDVCHSDSQGFADCAGGGEKNECDRIGTTNNADSGNRMFRRWPLEPGVGRMADGVARAVDRITALGNGQVPRVAATAFTILSDRFIKQGE